MQKIPIFAVLVALAPPAIAGSAELGLRNSAGPALLSTSMKGPINDIGALPYQGACDGVTDDTAAIKRAVIALSSTGGVLFIPASAGGCVVSSTIHLPAGVSLRGAGPHASHLKSRTANLDPIISLDGNGSGISDLEIIANGLGANISGTAILYTPNGAEQSVRNIIITGACIAVDLQGVTSYLADTTINDVEGPLCGGVRVGLNTTAANTVDPRVVNVTQGGRHDLAAAFGMEIRDAGGLIVTGSDFIFSQYGTRIVPGFDQEVDWATFNNTYVGDTNTISSLLIQPTAQSATVKGVQFSNAWFASAASSGVIISSASGGQISGVHFSASRFYNNGGGINILSGKDISIDNSHICGSISGSDGISVSSNVGNIHIRNNEISGSCDSYSTKPAHGISLGGGHSDIVITGNDLTGNILAIGGILSATRYQIAGNIGHHTGTPFLRRCGESPALAPDSDDERGAIIVGSGMVTACTLVFNTPYMASPRPSVALTPGNAGANLALSSTSSTAFTLSGGGANIASFTIYYSVRQ